MSVIDKVRDFVLPGTFGKGRRAKLTGIIASIYQILIYTFVLANICNSFLLYFRFGRINSFVTIYSELNGIETPSLIYCKKRSRFGNDINAFNGTVLMRILHYNRYYYSDNKNIRTCIYEGSMCLCIDAWKQSYYSINDLEANKSTGNVNNSLEPSIFQNPNSYMKLNSNQFSVFHPGDFPVPLFIRNEIDYQISTRMSMNDNDVKYKPHLINWCGLNIREDNNKLNYSKITNNFENHSSHNNNILNSVKNHTSHNIEVSQNIFCEHKDMVELLFISEDKFEGGVVGFYTSKNQFSSEPMWVKTSFPGIIFAFLQLEKNWIIDFLLLKRLLYHRMNPFYTIYKYFSNSNKNDLSPSDIDDENDNELNIDYGFQKKDKSYLITESQQIIADIAQFHGKVLPNDWSQWLNVHQQISRINGTNDDKMNGDKNFDEYIFNNQTLKMIDELSNLTNESSGLLKSNYSTLWVRSEYQIFVTPNTVRVANKHFLLKTFGLIMSIIFSLNYLNLFHSVFPYYRGEVPKLTVSPLTKFLSCNLLNSYHDKQ
ncbi:uncharacterized protein cubi_03666 [Cryptosporidium ubiquitum]|uniref:Uncharacterized protein n=1 Tax=Cryptosporidium ubiquitum TaxID=857276 RepID=A0A1J4MID6_9CRYT|nr:uncharacterized protein cubi_03666 [Cryptosporidium ubiquitum]OII72796.1 hypothetical protein cubi_03666 [Cryptosporidium ubiquitum]